jgi:Holliday junction resolvasome RuvABC endonuclease subunit
VIVLGLDLSLTSTGWVALKADDNSVEVRPTVIAFARVGPFEAVDEEMLRRARINSILSDVSEAIVNHKPTVIGIEDYSFGSVEQAHRLGELHGVIMHHLWLFRLNYERMPIGTWRKLALGNGQIPKDNVIAEVAKRWGEEFRIGRSLSIDVTEAYGVAVATWMRRLGADKPPSKLRRNKSVAQVADDPFR